MNNKVMIVDDENEVREAVCHNLGRNGLEAYEAAGYEQCLDLLEKGFKGVVLMDLIMPKKDGWDTIGEIVKRGYGKKTVIVLLTASINPLTGKSNGLVKYVADYIPKPASLPHLVETAKYYLKNFDENSCGLGAK